NPRVGDKVVSINESGRVLTIQANVVSANGRDIPVSCYHPVAGYIFSSDRTIYDLRREHREVLCRPNSSRRVIRSCPSSTSFRNCISDNVEHTARPAYLSWLEI